MARPDWFRLFLLSLVWGSAFFLIEIALRDTGPLTLVFFRLMIGAVALVIYCQATGIRITPSRNRVAQFAFMGLLANAVPFSLIALGQTQITSSLTAILIATTPLFTVLVGHLWKREEPATALKLSGVAMGFCGVLVLMGPSALSNLGGTSLGQALILAAAFSYAISAVFGRRFRDMPPVAAAACMLVAASIFMAPVMLIFEAPFDHMPSLASTGAVLALALLCTAWAYILYFTILKNAGATNAMLVTIVQPPLAILLGVLFLAETLSLEQLTGLILILAGLVLVDGRIFRRQPGRA